MSSGLTVFIPIFNSANWIRETILSIYSSSLSANVSLELLILNDASEDKSVEVIRGLVTDLGLDCKIVNLEKEHRRGSSSSSYTYSLTRFFPKYDLIAFCDHDDVWLPNKASRIFSHYEDGKDLEPWIYAGSSLVWNPEALSRPIFRSNPGPRGSKNLLGLQLDPRKTQFQVSVSTHNIAINRRAWDILSNNPLDPKAETVGLYFDYWMPFVISKVGISSVDLCPTLLWREHGKNASGDFSNRNNFINFFKRARRFLLLVWDDTIITRYITLAIYLQHYDSTDAGVSENFSANQWASGNFELFLGRLKLACSSSWKHGLPLVDIIVRLKIISLTSSRAKHLIQRARSLSGNKNGI